MFGQCRSGPVNRCVCAGSCQIVKCCLFPRVETIFRDKVLRCLFSESVSAELPFPHAAAWFSGVFLALGWLQADWISSFLTWDPFLGFVPSSSYSFLTFMLRLHHLLLQPQLHRFFPPFLLSLCLSVVPCCLPSSAQCDVSSCFAFYLELSALVSVLWGGVSVLSQPQLFDCMAPLNLMFFGFLAVGSSCCHFFSRTKAILFGE